MIVKPSSNQPAGQNSRSHTNFSTFCSENAKQKNPPVHYGMNYKDRYNRDATHVWKKIGKQKIYISAINGPSLPPKPLKTGVGPSVVQSCHSLSLLFGGERKIEKYVFPSSMALPCPPNPLKPPPNCHKFY